MKYLLWGLVASSLLSLLSCKEKELRLSVDNIDQIVASMTLEEKVALVVGTNMDNEEQGLTAAIGAQASLVPGAAGQTHSIDRLGIPATVFADGPAGLRIDTRLAGDSTPHYCTHFPIGVLLASTWNQELVEEVGRAMGQEVLEYGVDVLLAPAENIHRNPLNGRNFEYFSEDPVVSGQIAASYVRGIQSMGVGTSVKHFAFNNQETNRTFNSSNISTRAIREIYLKPFEITVRESQPWTIMTSYNKINGTYTSECKDLVETVLRGDWGFEGMVMTDWFGGKDGAMQMYAGNDMLQPGRPSQYHHIIDGIHSGRLSVEDLDRNVKRVLQYIVRTPRFKGYKYSNQPDLEAHAQITRQVGPEGMVLLENQNAALPLPSQVHNIALYGCTSYDFIAGGTGSGTVNRAYTVSLLDGLKQAGMEVDEKVSRQYADYQIWCEKDKAEKLEAMGDGAMMYAFLPWPLPAELIPSEPDLQEAAHRNDVAIITLGRLSGECLDRKVNDDFNLTQQEHKLIQQVCKAYHKAGKKVIVVLNVGGSIETKSWKNLPDAILLAWQAGQEGGNSVADILTGKANPSGKLTQTWSNDYFDHASSKNFPIEDFPLVLTNWNEPDSTQEPINTFDYTNYEEGIYVGYRWFDKQNLNVSYPFGYGLSYTDFGYGQPTLSINNDSITVTFRVSNTGKVPGKEVVQLYVSAPVLAMDKPVRELKDFAKTSMLSPGQSEEVQFSLSIEDLASYDEEKSAWIVDGGTYLFQIGASSRDIRSEISVQIDYHEKTTNKAF